MASTSDQCHLVDLRAIQQPIESQIRAQEAHLLSVGLERHDTRDTVALEHQDRLGSDVRAHLEHGHAAPAGFARRRVPAKELGESDEPMRVGCVRSGQRRHGTTLRDRSRRLARFRALRRQPSPADHRPFPALLLPGARYLGALGRLSLSGSHRVCGTPAGPVPAHAVMSGRWHMPGRRFGSPANPVAAPSLAANSSDLPYDERRPASVLASAADGLLRDTVIQDHPGSPPPSHASYRLGSL